MAQSDGGPAFPRPYSQLASGEQVWEQDGMSLRDWFAGQALTGILAARFATENVGHTQGRVHLDQATEAAYAIADAMLAARRPPESEGESDV